MIVRYNFDSLPSTNDYLLARDWNENTLCVAKTQTAGRGRLGRTWYAPRGKNLYFSLYWKFAKKINEITCIGLVVGISIMEALATLYPLPQKLGLKWPNDLEYEGAKLGGILVEVHRTQGLVIGVGLNVAMTERSIEGRSVTDLETVFATVLDPESILAACMDRFSTNFNLLETETGVLALLARWPLYDRLREQRRIFHTSDGTVIGTVEGINQNGELLVRVGDVIKTIRSGDVDPL